jgi:hypothetical protein
MTNILDVDPSAFERDYEYGRKWINGRQSAFVLGANIHIKKETGSKTLKLVLGIAAAEGGGKGVKVDVYVPLAGERYRDAVAAVAPEALRGGKVDLDAWANRPITVDVSEEIDKIATERTGVTTKRPRIERLLPVAPAAPATDPRAHL